MWLTSWESLLRILAAGTVSYAVLVFFLRVSGKRTLSKLNAFDFVVTVAIGSSFATVLLSKETPVAEGVWGLLLLVALQFVVTWISVRSKIWLKFVKSRPSLMLFKGKMLHENLLRQRLTQDDIYATLRMQGHARTEDVYAVILETDGSLSVVLQEPNEPPTCLLDAGIELPAMAEGSPSECSSPAVR